MVMQEILGADISFEGPEWGAISAEAADFVSRLLDRDYNTRLTAEQALQHPWIADLFCMESGHSGEADAALSGALGMFEEMLLRPLISLHP